VPEIRTANARAVSAGALIFDIIADANGEAECLAELRRLLGCAI